MSAEQEYINTLQAFLNGEKIERRSIYIVDCSYVYGPWTLTNKPEWNFHKYQYRAVKVPSIISVDDKCYIELTDSLIDKIGVDFLSKIRMMNDE